MDAVEEILRALPENIRENLNSVFSKIRFSFSQKLEIVKDEADLHQWRDSSFTSVVDINEILSGKDKRFAHAYMKAHREYVYEKRSDGPDYNDFSADIIRDRKLILEETDSPLIPGKCPCPVDGEKTRCCKLTTLDVIEQCGFACSYCSVQAFYDTSSVKIKSCLDKRLKNLSLDETIWHIGTGQASDSLFLGDDYSTLKNLSDFAQMHPNMVLELKSKSGRKDVFKHPYPKNMVFTWSVNAPTIIKKEEHLTASLASRLEAAEKARDNGNLVGFHIHPMMYFKGWENEYLEVVSQIERRFSPEDICMISIGTLTFTKSVIKHLRLNGFPSKVLCMELDEAAGKYSYSLEKKERMFSFVYSAFSEEFRKNIFFYLCMEDPSLWLKCLGREYSSDKEFEMDMKRAYMNKIANLV